MTVLWVSFIFDFFFLILHDLAPRIPTHSPCAPIHPHPAPMSFNNNFAWRIVFWPVRKHGARSHLVTYPTGVTCLDVFGRMEESRSEHLILCLTPGCACRHTKLPGKALTPLMCWTWKYSVQSYLTAKTSVNILLLEARLPNFLAWLKGYTVNC